MATYVNDLRLTELATGEGSGTWGVTTNTNLELIGEALGYGTQDCFATDADATTTVADGATDPARAMYFKVTSSATLTATRTLTIAPNTMTRVMLIENATTGSQSIAISQGSGGNVTIASGQVRMVYLDGAGAGAAVVDALADLELGTITVANLTATTADINGGTIDGATIATSDITVGSGKTLDVSAGTFTVANDQISGDAINGGTATPTTLTSTTVNATTVDTTNIEVTNLKAKDGTAAGSIADSTGVVTLSSSVLTTTDINGGTIDGVTIGGASAGAGTFTNLTATGTTTLAGASTTADITFGDDDKALFGAGNDLKIYHSANNQSYIHEVGTGDLNILASNFKIQNGAGTENKIVANTDGAVTLYYDNSAKLATTATGIDVTGTVTADGLTVDNGSVAGSYAVISNTEGTAKFGTDSNYARILDGSNNILLAQSNAESYYYNNGVKVIKTASGGDISFYEDTGTTPKFFWDASAESLGIGTSSPSDTLEVKASGNDDGIRLQGSGGANVAWLHQQSTDAATFRMYDGGNLNVLISSNANADSYFNTGGNVGIGTTSPATALDMLGDLTVRRALASTQYTQIQSGGGVSKIIAKNGAAASYQALIFESGNNVTTTERMRIDASGNLLLAGTGTPTSSAGNFVLYNGTAPTGSATDGVILYAEDVSASSELKVRDEAGNVTTLSPHNFDLIPEGPSEDMAWSYYSERDGKRINVDMLKAIRLLEQLSGEKLVHMV